MYIKRIANLESKLEKQSLFLFGPRQSGKTSYIANELKERVVLHWNLSDTRLRRRAMRDPGLLYEEATALEEKEGIIVVDEIQKAPELLDEVQRLMDETSLRFLLTGSSSRKLVSSGVNLLGGRAGRCHMFPFVYPEVRDTDYSLEHIFTSGLLPSSYLSARPDTVLERYIENYLYDEIQMEGAVRNLPAFSRFLEASALSNGNILNYTNVASDVGLSKTAIKEWYRILSDTLIGSSLEPFMRTKKRKAIETAKYYLFDVGLLRVLLGISAPSENQSEFGLFFETFLINELRAYLSYNSLVRKHPLTYWRSTSGYEVDAILGSEVAIEVKASKNLIPRDFRALKAFDEEKIVRRCIIVCREERRRLVENKFLVYPWKEFLEDLWMGKIIR